MDKFIENLEKKQKEEINRIEQKQNQRNNLILWIGSGILGGGLVGAVLVWVFKRNKENK